MLRSIVVLGIGLASLLARPGFADAQNSQTRQGFFINLGLGVGSFGIENGDDREVGGTGEITLGGTLTPQVLLAGEISGWTKDEGGARVTHTNVTAVVQFYPMVDGGLFLRGGVGGSRLEISASSGGFSFSAEDTGLGATAGLGYDIRVGSNFSITPYGLFAWGDFDGGSANHFQGGLGVTWH
ncbi:MAG: autotransporter domain-containing protein [Gemmatimonadales bacterium]